MPINLGSQPDHSFEQPIGLLSDCHRRIERFLVAQLEVAKTVRGGELDSRQSEALEKSLRYFAKAAPWHTQDEEQSLFPRLAASNDMEVQPTLEQMTRLEIQHRQAQAKHDEVDELIRRWLDEKVLSSQDAKQLLTLLISLQATYQEHIAFEDNVLFPLAMRVLAPGQIRKIGQEMAERRGVDANLPPSRCQHASPNRLSPDAITIRN